MNARILTTALTLTLAAAPALADHGHRDGGAIYDKARVVHAEPIVEVVQVPHRERECWAEEVETHRRGTPGAVGLIAGAVIGGVIGNQVGQGRGRDVATAAGAVIGAGVGHKMARRSGGHHVDVEEHCRVVDTYHEEERIVGYRVRYRYHGHDFTRRMDHDPGKWLRIRVTVTPVES